MAKSLLVLSVMLGQSAFLHAESRTFTDTSGRLMKGELVSVTGEMVTIKRDDGQTFTLKASTFSASDVDYFKEHGLAAAGSAEPKPQNVEHLWNDRLYMVHTTRLAAGPIATWTGFDPVTKHGVGLSTPQDVINYFKAQIAPRRSKGILIFSNSYLVPDTAQERKMLTEYQLKTWKEPEWIKSEAALIEDLRAACESEHIALYVNTSGNLKAPWRILVTPPPK